MRNAPNPHAMNKFFQAGTNLKRALHRRRGGKSLRRIKYWSTEQSRWADMRKLYSNGMPGPIRNLVANLKYQSGCGEL